jgi:hypothetical protein
MTRGTVLKRRKGGRDACNGRMRSFAKLANETASGASG